MNPSLTLKLIDVTKAKVILLQCLLRYLWVFLLIKTIIIAQMWRQKIKYSQFAANMIGTENVTGYIVFQLY